MGRFVVAAAQKMRNGERIITRSVLAAALAKLGRIEFVPTPNGVEPGLFEPQSPLPGNGFLKAETKGSKGLRRFAVAETKSRQTTRPFGGYSARTGKSPLERECVVADAVGIEPVSYPNSLLTGKFTGNLVEC